MLCRSIAKSLLKIKTSPLVYTSKCWENTRILLFKSLPRFQSTRSYWISCSKYWWSYWEMSMSINFLLRAEGPMIKSVSLGRTATKGTLPICSLIFCKGRPSIMTFFPFFLIKLHCKFCLIPFLMRIERVKKKSSPSCTACLSWLLLNPRVNDK